MALPPSALVQASKGVHYDSMLDWQQTMQPVQVGVPLSPSPRQLTMSQLPLSALMPNPPSFHATQVHNTSSVDVVKAAIGVRHAALITRAGELYTWGYGEGERMPPARDCEKRWLPLSMT